MQMSVVGHSQEEAQTYLPRIVIIGAQKSSTTFIRGVLFKHPKLTTTCFEHLMPHTTTSTECDYLQTVPISDVSAFGKSLASKLKAGVTHCPPPTDGLLFVDKPSYLSTMSPERIAMTVQVLPPQTVFVVILRDPLERMVSSMGMEACRVGTVQNQCGVKIMIQQFESMGALESTAGNEDPLDFVSRGMYTTLLEKWIKHVPRERMLMFYFEEVHSNSVRVANDILSAASLEQYDRLPPAVAKNPPTTCKAIECGMPARDRIEAAAAEHCETIRKFYEPEIRDLGSIVGRGVPGSWFTCDMGRSDGRLSMGWDDEGEW
jgi:hypothetical protein